MNEVIYIKTIRLRKVGNSFGFTIPKELMEKYHLDVIA